MALRNIRVEGDPLLRKKSKPVKEITDRIRMLAEDMLETMYDANGVGLAAPQVGILKRMVTIDVSEDGNSPMVLINPEILETEGEQTGPEGCLSLPGLQGTVSRPQHVKVAYTDLDGERITVEGDDLLARCFCHEIDHLDGVLYRDKADGPLHQVSSSDEEDEEDAEEDEEA